MPDNYFKLHTDTCWTSRTTLGKIIWIPMFILGLPLCIFFTSMDWLSKHTSNNK